MKEIWKDVIYSNIKKGMWVGISNKYFNDVYKLEFYSEMFNDYRN